MEGSSAEYCVPIWLSKWTFKDKRNNTYILDDHIVKGYNKGEIFTNKRIVNKAVNKLNGGRKKRQLFAVNLTLKSQHGYGVKD